MLFHLLFVLYPLAGWFIAVFTFVTPLRVRWWWKAVMSVLLLAGALKFLFYSGIGGSMFTPLVSRPVFVVWSYAFSAVMLLSGFAMLLWIARWTRRLARRLARRPGSVGQPGQAAGEGLARKIDGGWEWPCASRREFVSGAFAAAAAGLAAQGMHEGLRTPDVVRVGLSFPDLPAEFDGYRIVQISDTHVSSALTGERTEEIVGIVNSLKPDLVCFTGDIVDGTVEDRLADVRPFSEMRAADGVFGCAGNHELFNDYSVWRPRFEEFGIRMLDNSRAAIRRGGATLALGGVMDPSFGVCDAEAAFAGAPSGAFRILMMHRPIYVRANAALGVRLQLSGHTHGGGLNIFRPLVAPHNEGHIRGLYEESGMKLYVNAGTGQWAGFPMRLGNPSEITELTLRKA